MTPKLCTDCRFHRESCLNADFRELLMRCTRKEYRSEPSLVDGTTRLVGILYCDLERAASDGCGKEAQFFEPIPAFLVPVSEGEWTSPPGHQIISGTTGGLYGTIRLILKHGWPRNWWPNKK